MLDLIRLVLTNFWPFVAALLLLSVLGKVLIYSIQAARGEILADKPDEDDTPKKCQNCQFWRRANQDGHCKRRAPEGTPSGRAAHWPWTNENESCGEFQPATVEGARRE